MKRTYHGYEDMGDCEQHVAETIEELLSEDPEFSGSIKIVITRVDSDDEEDDTED